LWVFQESETKFSTIFYTTPDPVWIATLSEGIFLNINESFSQFWGDIPKNIIGKTCVQLGFWDNIEDLHHLRETLVNEGSILNFKVVIRTHSRQTKTVLLSAKVQYLGKEDCLIGVMRDVTDLYDMIKNPPLNTVIKNIQGDQIIFKGHDDTSKNPDKSQSQQVVQQMAQSAMPTQ
jgi:PAS domain S-box-containing protein